MNVLRPDHLPEGMRPRRRPTPSALVSVGLHLVLMVVVWQAVQLPAVFDRMLVVDRSGRAR